MVWMCWLARCRRPCPWLQSSVATKQRQRCEIEARSSNFCFESNKLCQFCSTKRCHSTTFVGVRKIVWVQETCSFCCCRTGGPSVSGLLRAHCYSDCCRVTAVTCSSCVLGRSPCYTAWETRSQRSCDAKLNGTPIGSYQILQGPCLSREG